MLLRKSDNLTATSLSCLVFTELEAGKIVVRNRLRNKLLTVEILLCISSLENLTNKEWYYETVN